MKITSETPSSALPLGTTVCKSGITTGVTCGEVADIRSTRYKGKLGQYIRVRNANGSVMNDDGDSGGPVFGPSTAYGLVHARGALGTPTRNDLYFMPIERLSVLGLSTLTKPFELASVPNVSGPAPSIPVNVNFTGYPRFPVDLTVEVVACPSGWTCTGGTIRYESSAPSPLTYSWGCSPGGLPLPATFMARTRLKDASGINPPAVEHSITCTNPSPLTPPASIGSVPSAGLQTDAVD